MEEAIIIIAACVPLLKCPIERLLQRFGLPTLGRPARTFTNVELTPPSGNYDSGKELSAADSSGTQNSEGTLCDPGSERKRESDPERDAATTMASK